MTPSSLREMPTVTVLAWCLIASTGRVSSSIALRERGEQVVDERRRRADLARLGLVLLDRVVGQHVAQQAGEAHRRARLEVPVVAWSCATRRRTARRSGRSRRRTVASIWSGDASSRTACSITSRASRSGTRRRVDGERRFVAEEVPDHRREHERDGGVDRRHGDRRGARVPGVAVVGDDDRRRLVRPEDRHLLAHVVGRRAGEPGGAHEDHRLRRQVDVLLVLGDVAGDRLVAELAELDPDLLGGDLVDAVADDRPVALRRCEPTGRLGDRLAAGSTVRIASGRLAQRRRAARAGAARSGSRLPR